MPSNQTFNSITFHSIFEQPNYFEYHYTPFPLIPNAVKCVKKQRIFVPWMLKKIINKFHTLPPRAGGVKKVWKIPYFFFILFLRPSLRLYCCIMWSDDNLIFLLTFDQSRSIFTSQDVPRRSQRQTSPPQRRRCQGPSVRVRRPRTRPGTSRCCSSPRCQFELKLQ